MLYTYPDYYKDFNCIADRCEDTCCAGWQIVVDEESLDNYKSLPDNHPFKERMEQSVDWQEGVFKQDKCRRCAFLNDKNLCDMYTALGQESLCYTCTSYPRHTEEFEDVREVTLSLSCPEVARMVLNKQDKTTFYQVEEPDEAEDYDDFEDFDTLMYGIQQDARTAMISIMQDRTMDIQTRATLVWQMAEQMQSLIDEGAIFECEDIIEKYVELNKFQIDSIQSQSQPPTLTRTSALALFQNLYRLEVLNEDWETQVDEAALLLYSQNEEFYTTLTTTFHQWLSENKPNWHIQCEQIVVYFLATYLCGAVYDGQLVSKVKMSVASIFYIHELLMAQWQQQGRQLSDHDIVQMVYRYSRELEHSDINLEELETCFQTE